MATMVTDEKHAKPESTDEVSVEGVGITGLDESNLPKYNDKETKRILRKIDYRLLPVLTLLYLLSFLDRGNIGNARVAGMSKELKLTGAQYNMALTVFFFPYTVFEIPSNIVLKLIRPSRWIQILVISWGIVITLQGIVHSYGGLIATRTMLGFAESGFFPAATYLLTTWYCRYEIQTRMSIFFSAGSMAGAFSGLLAFAIQKMEGVAGLGGWRWIFILEGIFTVVIGSTLHWIMPDSPDTATFLTPEEKAFINARLIQDSGTAEGTVRIGDSFQWRYLKAALTEWKIYFAVIIYWGNAIVLSSFSFSAPTIILELGYTAAQAQLLTVPIYVVAVGSTIFFSVMADRQRSRWPSIVIPFSIALIGVIALISIPHPRLPGLTYFFLYFIPAGTYPPLIGALSWIGNNLAPTWKRAIGMALLISIGGLGGAIGSNIFLQNQAPHYWLGYGFSIAILASAIVSTFVLRFAYERENKQRDKMSVEEVRAKYSEEELLDMGDKSPLFRYVI